MTCISHFNFLNFLPVFLYFASSFHLGISLNCSVTTSLEDKSLPKVALYKGTFLDYSQENRTKSNETQIIFDAGEETVYILECTHNKPVKWIYDADPVGRGLEGSSQTYRCIGNFSDNSTYMFQAIVQIRPKTKDELVISCQTINDPCSRQVVLASLDENIKKFNVKLLSKDEENTNSFVAEFDQDILDSESPVSAQGLASNNKACPFKLKLCIENFDIVLEWSVPGGLKNELKLDAAQSFENQFRFTPKLNEACIDFGKDCPSGTVLKYSVHQFKPLAMYYAVDDQRVLKTYFDLKRNYYYEWEKAPAENLVKIKLPSNKTVFKGQSFEVICYSSPVMFSIGTQLAWAVANDNYTNHFIENSQIKNHGVAKLGVINATGVIQTDKSFLDTVGAKTLKISCFFPVWNSYEWGVAYDFMQLLDSKTPEISGKEVFIKEVQQGENFTFKCEAEGYPLPTLSIDPPQLNLLLETTTTTRSNYTELSVTIPMFQLAYAGKYTCIAKSLVGEDFKVYELKLGYEFPLFAKISILIGIVATILFIVTASALVYKLRKEKKEFLLLTEEAVRKFKEGFKNTPGIGFDSNSDYQAYEVPLTRWGLGGTMLGSGAFGIVQKGYVQLGENQSKTLVAVKTVNSPKDIKEFENSLMELAIMSFLGSHDHVVSLIAACTTNLQKRSILIGVEYCANGDLLSYLQKRRSLFHSYTQEGKIDVEFATGKGSYANVANAASFSTVDLCRWSYQIANGMDFLELKKVLHADLAARNVLISQDKIAKISDFGLSRQLLDSNNYTKKTNSPLPWRWMAIESLKFQQFSPKSDVWAYGITLYEIFSLGSEPWPGLGWTIEFVNELERGRRLVRPNYGTVNMYENVMLECWRNEPGERITFAHAKKFFEIATSLLTSIEGKTDKDLAIC